MAKIRFVLVLAALALAALVLAAVSLPATPGAQTLSSQVLQLLSRVNTWTGQQTFQDLRLSVGSPSDTTNRLYNVSSTLYWNGAIVSAGGGGGAVHNLLSATHGDVTVGTVLRGSLIVGQGGTPTWERLVLGSAGTVLRSDGTDAAWSTDGSGLTGLSAAALASGTVPLARISGLTDAQVAAGAGIAWSKVDKAGGSLADLTTRSATDLTSGTLADARLSANVSLFGASVDTAEITDGAILFADWNANGCTSGQYPQYNGSAWICGTVTPGTGTVTSVGLSMPAIFSVSGSPVTGSGTLTAALVTQTANLVWAGPNSGGAAAPTFRSLVYADLPTSAATPGTYPKVTINAQGIVTGAASQITLTTDVTGVLPLANGGTGLNAAADDSVLLSNGSAWAAAALSNCTTGLTYATASNSFGCASAVGSHALLSASHSDTLTDTVVQGDLIIGSGTPQWVRLPISTNNRILTSTGLVPEWRTSILLQEASASLTVAGSRNGLSTGTSGTFTVSNQVKSGPYSLLSSLAAQFGGVTSAVPYAAGDLSLGAFGIGGALEPSVGASAHMLRVTGYFVEAGSGTHALTAVAHFGTTGAALSGAATTAAATVYIENEPTHGATNAALWVDAGAVRLDEGLYEYTRTVKQGSWQARTYAGGDFTANGSMTWTVDSGDIGSNVYTLVGQTLQWTFQLNSSTVGGTLNSELRVAAPGTFNRTCVGSFHYVDNTTPGTGFWQALSGNAYVTLRKDANSPNWSAATDATSVYASITCELQ